MYFRSLAFVHCICHQVYCISYHVSQEPHLVYCTCQQVYCICHHVNQKSHLGVLHLSSSVLQRPLCTSGCSLGCITFAIKCTAEAIMYIRNLTWVYCIWNQVYYRGHHVHLDAHLGVLHLQSSVLQRPSCTSGATLGYTTLTIMYFRSLTWVYCICHQKTCISYHVNQKPRFGVLHLPSSVLQRQTCTLGASLGCTAFAIKCTAYAIMYFRSLTWVYCICHQVHCISYHVIQEPYLVYCICQQVYCICQHIHQKPHLGVLNLPSSVLQNPQCVSGSSLGCTAFAIKCTAEAIMYIRSRTWVYCICHQVYCICHHLTSGASPGCTAFGIKCTSYAIMYIRRLTWCTVFAIKCSA